MSEIGEIDLVCDRKCVIQGRGCRSKEEEEDSCGTHGWKIVRGERPPPPRTPRVEPRLGNCYSPTSKAPTALPCPSSIVGRANTEGTRACSLVLQVYISPVRQCHGSARCFCPCSPFTAQAHDTCLKQANGKGVKGIFFFCFVCSQSAKRSMRFKNFARDSLVS